MAHLLQLANCNRPNLSQKGYKSSMLQLPRLPLFYKRTPEGYFEAKTGVFNKTHFFFETNTYVRPPISIFHQHFYQSFTQHQNILFKCDILPCAQAGITPVGDRASSIHYRINNSSKLLLKAITKCINLHFMKFCCKT